MNRKSFLESARSGAAVALGIAGVFGGSFLVTTIVAQAQEQTPAAANAPAAPTTPESVTATPPAAPAPKAEPAPRRPDREGPPRPAFKDFDTNGDGTISQAEFEAFRPTPPPRPPRYEDERYRDAPEARDWRDDRGAPRPPRRGDQYSMNDDRRGPPPPPDDRYREPRGDDRWGPPPPPDDRYAPHARGGRGPEGYGDRGGDSGRGGDCDHGDRDGGPRDHRGPRPEHGGPRPDDGRGYRPDDRTPPPPPAPEN